MPSDSMEHEYITQYIRPQQTRKEVMSSLQARRGEVKMDMAPMGLSTPPSQWLQSGRVRTYQDIIQGRLRGEQKSEQEVLPWNRGNTGLRRRVEREKEMDRFSILEGEDTWSGSSDWVENRLGQEDWTDARLGREEWTNERLGQETWHSGGEQSLGRKKYIIGGSYIIGNVYTIRFRNS